MERSDMVGIAERVEAEEREREGERKVGGKRREERGCRIHEREREKI
jgi:hypothetical protein